MNWKLTKSWRKFDKELVANGPEVDSTLTGSLSEVDKKLVLSQLEVVRKWFRGLKSGHNFIGSELETDRKLTRGVYEFDF